MGGKKGMQYWCVEMVVVMAVAGMMWVSSAQPPTSPGPCWLEVANCLQNNLNQSTQNQPTTSFNNVSEALCCPLIQQTAQKDKTCFCSISDFLHQNPAGPNMTLILTICNVIDSLASFDAFCPGSASTPSEAPIMSPPGSASTPAEAPMMSPPAPVGKAPTSAPVVPGPQASGPAASTPEAKSGSAKFVADQNGASNVGPAVSSLVLLLVGFMLY